MSCIVKGLVNSTKADDFPFCTAQCTTGPGRDPKDKEHSVCIYLATCKLVNALSYVNPDEEASRMWLSGLALGLHRTLVMHSRERNSVCVEIIYCILSDLCTHMFFNSTSIYMHVYMCIL